MMEFRKLGSSDLNVSAISMGCWAIGGRAWGRVDDRQSHEAIEAALETGVNLFDTADVYGFGHSEEVLGKALKRHADALIATKVGLRWDTNGRVRHDLLPAYIRQACEASLRRLGRERIDLYQIHCPDSATPLAAALETMATLVDEGKVRYIGGSNLEATDLAAAAKRPSFISYQDQFNLLQQPPPGLNPAACRKHRIGFIAYEPLLKGLLTGKHQEAPRFGRKDHRRTLDVFGDGFDAIRTRTARLVETARKYQIKPAPLALALLLDDATTAAVGVKSAAQMRENAGACDVSRTVIEAARTELADILCDNEPHELTE